jgi:DNA-binding response OmpR family regulator
MLMAQRPDIIVLDLAVSRVSGYEVLLGLRRACPELPILVIAHDIGRPGYKLGPMVLGATDVLAKNVSQFELMQRVAFALQLAGPPPEPTTSTCTSLR